MPENTVWCWAESAEAESWAGPFRTREAAVSNGTDENHCDPFVVADGHYPDVVLYVADAVVELIDLALENAEDAATDDAYAAGDDGLLQLIDRDEAEAKLRELVAECWARRYVKAVAFTVDRDTVQRIEP